MTRASRRTATTLALVAGAAALATSLGVDPRLAAEAALLAGIVALLAQLLRGVSGAPRSHRRRPLESDPTDVGAGARDTVEAALDSDWGVRVKLRPAVREIAEARLAAAHGRSLDDDPEATSLLPDPVRELLADVGRPSARAPGMTPAQFDRLLSALEEQS